MAARSSDPIHIRLNAEAEKLRQEQIKREQKRLEDETKEATFAPTISARVGNPQSLRFVLDGLNSIFTLRKNLFAMFLIHRSKDPAYLRLNALADKSKQEQTRKVEEKRADELKGLTFAPDLSATANFDKLK